MIAAGKWRRECPSSLVFSADIPSGYFFAFARPTNQPTNNGSKLRKGIGTQHFGVQLRHPMLAALIQYDLPLCSKDLWCSRNLSRGIYLQLEPAAGLLRELFAPRHHSLLERVVGRQEMRNFKLYGLRARRSTNSEHSGGSRHQNLPSVRHPTLQF